jgi:acyl-CoA thioester hydrolase
MSDTRQSRFSAGNPFVLSVRVLPEHIDAQGHASNVAILNWMNEAAIAHSAHLGYNAHSYRILQSMFVVRRHEIDYKRPARLGDELLCATWPSHMEKATAHRRHEILRTNDGQLIATGFNIWAYVDMTTGRPRRIPDEVLAAFNPALFV